MNWEEMPQVKMGNLGEQIVREYFIEKGIVPYLPAKGTGPHPFDFLCASRDKKRIFIAEVKTKPARLYYPDTGFNLSSWYTYLNISEEYNMDIWVFFVDTNRCSIYGNKLKELKKPRAIEYNGKQLNYPLAQNRIIYFPLEAMVKIRALTVEQKLKIEQHTTRSYNYEATP
jgi:hypothetical protein